MLLVSPLENKSCAKEGSSMLFPRAFSPDRPALDIGDGDSIRLSSFEGMQDVAKTSLSSWFNVLGHAGKREGTTSKDVFARE